MIAGVICSVLVLAFSVADAALLFRGDLNSFLITGVALAVFGCLIQIVVIGSFTQLRSTHGTSQEACIVIISAMLFSLQGSVQEDALLPTSLVMISLSGLSLGASLFICGALKAGRYIRLMPFPMIAGFLAGSGLLTASFAVSILHGEPLSLTQILKGESDLALLKIALGLVMGGALILLGSWRWSEYTLPALIVASIFIFHAVIWAIPSDLSAIIDADWTLSREPVELRYQSIDADLLHLVDWHAVLRTSPQLLSLVAVCVFASLIKISSLELLTRQRIDENKELRLAGYANLLSGVFAVAPGFHGLSNSSIVIKLRGNGPMSALVTLVLTCAILFFAGDMLIQMPRFIFGAILIWVGIGMINDSLLANWGKLRKHESVITLLIALSVLLFGFLPGLLFGALCGLVMFVTDYAQHETVRSFQSGAQLHSNVDRNPCERNVLKQHANGVWVIGLNSYLFFGSAARSVDQITQHLDSLDDCPAATLVLDFTRVTGIDSTAMRAFHRLALHTESEGILVWGCGANDQVQSAFNKDGNGSIACFFESRDLALETAENNILSAHTPSSQGVTDPVSSGELALASVFNQYAKPLSLCAGEILLHSGEASKGLFWVVTGLLDAQVHSAGANLRVRRMAAGALIGEISWYLQKNTSASVVVIEPSSVLHLNPSALQRLSIENPELTAQLHSEIARILASRLADNARQLRQLV